MAYVSRNNRRPAEYASRGGHTPIINHQTVQSFIGRCSLPPFSRTVELGPDNLVPVPVLDNNPIELIIAVDGGFGEAVVRKEYPSSTIHFFNYGALIFRAEDLDHLKDQPFIDPADMSKLKNIRRFHFVLPSRNLAIKGFSLVNSVRQSFLELFGKSQDGERPFMESLRWLIFEEYRKDRVKPTWNLAGCPNCDGRNISISSEMPDVFPCPYCHQEIHFTDIFRLHEVIDDELGAGGIIGYTMNLLEQLLIVHLIKTIWDLKPDLLKKTLFIKDGPLAFFGQTANLHKPMRNLVAFLASQDGKVSYLNMVGIEKSGAFVDHANEIRNRLPLDHILILDNEYIYRHIIPGTANSDRPYGSTTYFGNKMIYRTQEDRLYLLTIPTTEILAKPETKDFPGLFPVLNNVRRLKCDMYDDALLPVALVNKLVSLSQHPSMVLLEQFAKKQLG